MIYYTGLIIFLSDFIRLKAPLKKKVFVIFLGMKLDGLAIELYDKTRVLVTTVYRPFLVKFQC
jgi:hypothetical protein